MSSTVYFRPEVCHHPYFSRIYAAFCLWESWVIKQPSVQSTGCCRHSGNGRLSGASPYRAIPAIRLWFPWAGNGQYSHKSRTGILLMLSSRSISNRASCNRRFVNVIRWFSFFFIVSLLISTFWVRLSVVKSAYVLYNYILNFPISRRQRKSLKNKDDDKLQDGNKQYLTSLFVYNMAMIYCQ